MRRFAKHTILILCLTALVAIGATETALDYTQLVEDIDIMARVIDKTLEGKFPNEYKSPYGISISVEGFQGCQGFYLKGYGAVFITGIQFPVAARKVLQKQEATPDELWQKTRDELKSGIFVPSGSLVYNIEYGLGGGQNYDSIKVEALKEELLKLIGTYAPNIRQLGPQDNIVIVVKGMAESHPFAGVGYAPKATSTPTAQEEVFIKESPTPRPVSVPSDPNAEKAKTVYLDTLKGESVAVKDMAANVLIATSGSMAGGGRTGGRTTLIVKASKASITAYKDSTINLAKFKEQVETTQY